MRRRRLLSLGAAVAGLSGCMGVAKNDREAPTGAAKKDGDTPTGGPTEGAPTETTSTRYEAVTTSIGGSLHGRPYRVGDDIGLVGRSGTNVIHAFLDVRKKYNRDVTPEDDPDVVALRRASREMGAKLYVSLQWNFIGIFGEQEAVSMPSSGSTREDALIEFATELLTAIGEPVEIVGLGNEPIWETLDADFVGSDAQLLSFTRKLKDHLLEHYTVGDPRYVLGAFNRLYSEQIRSKYGDFYRRLFEMARTDDDVDGIDLHVHYAAFHQAERMLEVARERFPEGLITATEFSPIWRYNQYKNEPIGSFDGGDRFASRHGVSDGTTVTEYLEGAKYDRLSPEEIGDFYATMPWYNVNFVDDMYRLLDEYGVEVGTFGFLVESDVRQLDWTEDWAPFPINCLFQPALIDTEDGAHPHYLDDFRERV